jgi:hypothetical protein
MVIAWEFFETLFCCQTHGLPLGDEHEPDHACHAMDVNLFDYLSTVEKYAISVIDTPFSDLLDNKIQVLMFVTKRVFERNGQPCLFAARREKSRVHAL